MTSSDVLVRQTDTTLVRAGARVRRVHPIGRSSWLFHISSLDGQPGVVRVATYPEHLIRDDLRTAHADAGWTGAQRLADTGRSDAPQPTMADVVTAVTTAFGTDPVVRDQLISDTVRAERHARAARTRSERKAAVEHSIAASIARDFTPGTNFSVLDVRVHAAVRAADLPRAAASRIRSAAMRMIVAHLPRPTLWRASAAWYDDLIAAYDALALDRLATAVRNQPRCEPDALRAAAYDILRHDPRPWLQASQHLWLASHLPLVLQSDLIPSTTFRALVVDGHAGAPATAAAADHLMGRIRAGLRVVSRADIAAAATSSDTVPPWWVANELQVAAAGRLGPIPLTADACTPFRSEADLLTLAATT